MYTAKALEGDVIDLGGLDGTGYAQLIQGGGGVQQTAAVSGFKGSAGGGGG